MASQLLALRLANQPVHMVKSAAEDCFRFAAFAEVAEQRIFTGLRFYPARRNCFLWFGIRGLDTTCTPEGGLGKRFQHPAEHFLTGRKKRKRKVYMYVYHDWNPGTWNITPGSLAGCTGQRRGFPNTDRRKISDAIKLKF